MSFLAWLLPGLDPGTVEFFRILGWILAALVGVQVIPLGISMLIPRRLLGDNASLQAGGEEAWPVVAVIVPARDEEEALEDCLTSLLAQDYPRLEIIAVNDRSRDRTPEIIDRLAARHERLRAVHVEELPGGWLGKNHANHRGASSTDSDWILFTDGDVRFRPDALRRAITHVRTTGVDHLTAMPRLESGGAWESLMTCVFTMFFCFRFQPWLVRTRAKWSYMGVGAFNLISRSTYEEIGTHRELRLEVADDVKLGKRVKEVGRRQDVIDGTELCSVRWQVGLGGFIRGLAKNAFAGLEYSLWQASGMTFAFVALYCFPYLALVLFPSGALGGYLVSVAGMHLAFLLVLYRARAPLVLTVLLPVAEALFLITIWRSVWITLRQGGVTWRDTFYSLDELKRGRSE